MQDIMKEEGARAIEQEENKALKEQKNRWRELPKNMRVA